MKKKYYGQNIVEVCVITVLVVLGGMGAVYLFGDKMRSFFGSDSAVTKTADVGTNAMNSSSGVDFQEDFTQSVSVNSSASNAEKSSINIANTNYLADYTIANYSYDENTDGLIPSEEAILAAQAAAAQAAVSQVAPIGSTTGASTVTTTGSTGYTSTTGSTGYTSTAGSTSSSSGCDTACLVARAKAATAAAKSQTSQAQAATAAVQSGSAAAGSARDDRQEARAARQEAREARQAARAACAADPTDPACS